MQHRLENSTWGFGSNCFVCEASNPAGLHIPFFHDDDDATVSARFTLDNRFSGTPRYVHGGVTLAILDEAMAWATIAVLETFAVTRTMTTTFHRPVKVGLAHRVQAAIAEPAAADGTIVVTAVVTRETDDRRCVEAEARFVAIAPEGAADAIGAVDGADTRYLKNPDDPGSHEGRGGPDTRGMHDGHEGVEDR